MRGSLDHASGRSGMINTKLSTYEGDSEKLLGYFLLESALHLTASRPDPVEAAANVNVAFQRGRREGGREGGKEGRRERGKEGGREGGKEGGREGRRERGKEAAGREWGRGESTYPRSFSASSARLFPYTDSPLTAMM